MASLSSGMPLGVLALVGGIDLFQESLHGRVGQRRAGGQAGDRQHACEHKMTSRDHLISVGTRNI
jgi:hypothetical protein